MKPRIDLENRTRLETVIPLSVPFIINIDPSDACNFRCKFCPTGDRALMRKVGRPLKVMDLGLYKKIIDDICMFDHPIKVLRLYKDGEPLMNPNIVEMIQYAKESKCSDRIDITTNASLLTPEISKGIVEAGLTRINISVEGVSAKQYADFSNYKINFPRFIDNIKYLYGNRKGCEIIIKTNGDTLDEKEKQDFLDLFGNIADGVFIEHIMSCWPEFDMKDGLVANNEYGIYGQKIEEVSVCPYIFYSFSINSDGKASACFLDWSKKLIIGDVTEESVVAIWNSNRLKELQKMMLRKDRKQHAVCGECGQMSHGAPDNIDSYADILLNKIV